MTSPSPTRLPLRWAVILLAAEAVQVAVGAVTLRETGSWPAAFLAALGAAGATVSALHRMLAA